MQADLDSSFPLRNIHLYIYALSRAISIELSVKSPPLSPPSSSAFAPLSPSFSDIHKFRKFYAQTQPFIHTRLESNYSTCTSRSSENICVVAAMQALREKETEDESNSVYDPNLVEKLVWLLVISFCKIFIPSYEFDALLCQNWPFSPPNIDNSNMVLLSNACFHLEEEY